MSNELENSKAMLIRRWGEMGGYWGINRTMAEIHALMYVTRKPLCTDDVMDLLKVSRGNASMNLRALVDWGLVRRVHILGDRKEYFEADTSVWRMFETIMRERRRREVEPIIATIDRCREMVSNPQVTSPADVLAEIEEYRRRLDELRNFLATMGALFEMVLQFGDDGLRQVRDLIGGGAPATGGLPPRRNSAPIRHGARDASGAGGARSPRRRKAQ
ncbi:MAG: hypothetical protein CHACPFDD_00253 [Phycisphaerae bacterium]|nr:hypothetical protein [Phycisphaerae bacterium]